MNVVGVSAHFHDSACCLLRDGVLVAAAQEERFSRRKHDPAAPSEAFRYCLREGGLSPGDVDCVAYYENPPKKLERQLLMWLTNIGRVGPAAAGRLDPRRPERDIRQKLGFDGRIEFVDHHESHAASSFYYSGFEEAALFTVDGVGEWATTTYGRGAGSAMHLFEQVDFPDSLGLLYSTVTSYLGFDVNDAEYKVMGLAPYGAPVHEDKVRSLIQTLPGGQYRLVPRYFDFGNGERMYADALIDLFGEAPRTAESELRPFHHDLARSLQRVLEEILLEKVRFLHERTSSENLCMAGGVALNCVANGRILREGPFERLFVQPAASDAGSALGAAAVAHVRLSGKRPSDRPLDQVFLGPAYSAQDIEDLLRPMRLGGRRFADESALLEATVQRLAAGKVVGWFQGRMEFGPRALGARSIIADPRGPQMRERINALVKKREAFRPFAPAVLEEKAREHFDLDHPSPFMLETCQVRSPLDLPAVTHVDGSARVQTVNERINGRFARLIAAFDRSTGCPILLNTSFNLRGEPIVMTPLDALWCFVRCQIDTLVLGDVLIDSEDVPEFFRVLGGMAGSPAPPVSHSVYSFL